MPALTDKWIEIFKGGRQTDSQGRTRDFSESDLDEIVANHNADHPAPIVVGHPKNDDPAFGWTSALKRVGDTVLAKFTQIEPKFEKAVEDGRYRNRSVKITPSKNGWKLVHVGWLGAAPPAVEGLAPAFSEAEPEGEVFEFTYKEAWRYRTLVRMFRGLREHLAVTNGQETADQVLPEHEINALEEAVIDEEVEERLKQRHDHPAYSHQFMNKPATEDVTVPDPNAPKTFTQAEVDAAVNAAKAEAATALQTEREARAQLQYSQSVATHRTYVENMVNKDGKCVLTPAQAAGLPEFMARLEAVENNEFEFSVGEGKTEKTTLLACFQKHLESLPEQLRLKTESAGEDVDQPSAAAYVSASGSAVDQERLTLHRKAKAYQAKHEGVTFTQAVEAVEAGLAN